VLDSGAPRFRRAKVAGFVVADAVEPAAVQDADPLTTRTLLPSLGCCPAAAPHTTWSTISPASRPTRSALARGRVHLALPSLRICSPLVV
jgi:hypothetical protein